MKFNFSFFHVLHRKFSELGHFQKPLFGKHRLNHRAASRAKRHVVRVILDFCHELQLLHVFHNLFSRLRNFQTFVSDAGFAAHASVRSDDPHDGHFGMPLPDFKVRDVVRGGNFNHAGSELGVGGFVGDNFYF